MVNRKVFFELIRFSIVGGLATITHYGLYLLLMELIGVNIAYSIGYVVSFVVNYFLTAAFTFKTSTTTKRAIGFMLCHAINYGLHIVLLNIFISYGIPSKWAPIPVLMVAIPLNFILVRSVFRSKLFK